MTGTNDGRQVTRLALGEWLGARVDAIGDVPCFAGNRVLEAVVDGRPVFVKHAPPVKLASEAAVLDLLHRAGVPVPTVMAQDLDGDRLGLPAIVIHAAEGAPLDGQEPAFATAARHLAAVHEIAVPGHGPLAVGTGSLAGTSRSWQDAVLVTAGGLPAIVQADLVPAALADRMTEVIQSIADLGPTDDGHLLHGDFHPRHVFAVGDRVTAIIDWGEAAAGDPLWDLGRVLHATTVGYGLDHGNAVLGHFLSGHGRTIDATEHRRLLVYAIAFIAGAMADEHAAGSPWPPWWTLQTLAVEELLQALTRRLPEVGG